MIRSYWGRMGCLRRCAHHYSQATSCSNHFMSESKSGRGNSPGKIVGGRRRWLGTIVSHTSVASRRVTSVHLMMMMMVASPRVTWIHLKMMLVNSWGSIQFILSPPLLIVTTTFITKCHHDYFYLVELHIRESCCIGSGALATCVRAIVKEHFVRGSGKEFASFFCIYLKEEKGVFLFQCNVHLPSQPRKRYENLTWPLKICSIIRNDPKWSIMTERESILPDKDYLCNCLMEPPPSFSCPPHLFAAICINWSTGSSNRSPPC